MAPQEDRVLQRVQDRNAEDGGEAGLRVGDRPDKAEAPQMHVHHHGEAQEIAP